MIPPEGSLLATLANIYVLMRKHHPNHKEVFSAVHFEKSGKQGYTCILVTPADDAVKLLQTCEQQIQKAREEGDRVREFIALNDIAYIYSTKIDSRCALQYYEQCLEMAREHFSPHEISGVLINVGINYERTGDRERALECYKESLNMTREIGDKESEGRALCNMGNTYANIDEPYRAIECYVQCLDIARKRNDDSGMAYALGNLGLVYATLGDTQEAMKHHEMHLFHASKVADFHSEATALCNIGITHRDMGNLDEAHIHFNASKKIFERIGSENALVQLSWEIGLLYEIEGDFKQAAELMQRWVDYLEQINHANPQKYIDGLERVRAKLAQE